MTEGTKKPEAPAPRFLMLLAERLVPEVDDLDAPGRAEMERRIGDALDRRTASERRQLAVFLFLLRWGPALVMLRPWDALPVARQDRVLRWFEGAPVPKLRAGFWGLKALVFMGYYGRAGAGADLHYAPVFDGNRMLP